MKTLIKQIGIALVIISLAAVSVVAKTRKESISFTSNTTVNGTLVKKGTYQLKFDDEKGELSIVKDGKVIAQASTTSEKREAKAANLNCSYPAAAQKDSWSESHLAALTKTSYSMVRQPVVKRGPSISNYLILTNKVAPEGRTSGAILVLV